MFRDFGIPGDDAVTRDAIMAAEAQRSARELYEAQRVAREAFEAGRAVRDAAISREAAMVRDATLTELAQRAALELTRPKTVTDLSSVLADSPAWRAAQSLLESPTVRMMKVIEESPTVRMMRGLEQSPAVQMMRVIEESSAMRLMRQVEESPAIQLSRSIAENLKLFDVAGRVPNPVLVGALGDSSVVASLAGIAALHDWGASARLREYASASSVIASQLGTFATLTDVSRRLIEQMNAVNAFAALPTYLQSAPTLESYASASTLHLFLPEGTEVGDVHVMDLLAEDMLDGVSEEFEARLASLDQALLKPVRGAWQTALSNTEDRVRQSAVSIRFVVEEMIKQLAPRADAEAWAHSIGVSRKPPKAAKSVRSAGNWAVQLRFIMRHVDALAESTDGESVFGYLAEVDLIDMLVLIERLNQAVHEPEGHITEEDLSLVLRRVMAFMTLLLDAYEFEAPGR